MSFYYIMGLNFLDFLDMFLWVSLLLVFVEVISILIRERIVIVGIGFFIIVKKMIFFVERIL